MKIKYRKLDNVIVAMGECDFTPDIDHEVDSVAIDIPSDDLSNYKRIPGGIERKSQIEIDADINAVKVGRRNAKREVLNALATATGLTKAKILKGLKMALDDGNDD